jgi:prevent-host-death family protein
MIRLPTTEAREQLAELVNRAAFRNERIVLTRHGKDVAVLVTVEDLARLQALDEVSPRPPPLPVEESKAAHARIQATMRAIQQQAQEQGSSDLSDEDIAAEIASVRDR